GHVIAQNLGNQSYVDPDVVLIPAVNGTYTLRIVPFNPQGLSIEGKVSLVPFPAVAPVDPGTPPTFSNHISPSTMGNSAGEPSIGVDWNPRVAALRHDQVNTGGVTFFTAGTEQLRVSFNDASFPAVALWENTNAPVQDGLDPIGFVDRTTGRVFGLELAAGDSNAAYSDDDGATWMNFVAGGAPAGPDHETFGGGPYRSDPNATPPVIPPPHPLYPNAIYYCSQNIAGGAECSRSDDGGLTFGPGVDIFNPVECYGGIHGHVKVAPDGTVYVPNSSCSAGTGSQGAAVSRDNGMTWTDTTVPGSIGTGDPSVGIGADGTAYIGYINGDGRPHVAVSTDNGAIWSKDWEVGQPIGCAGGDQYADCRIKSAVFPVVVAGDGDRAAFGFLGSTEGGNYQDLNSFHGIWNFYIATTYDRGDHWVTVNATEGDPVQKGAICLAGILCSSGNRNLLDFNDIAVDREGRSIAAYADGCVSPTCGPPDYTGRAKKAAVVRQASGRRLFAAFDSPLVVSRKNHGSGSNVQDIPLPLTGSPGVECRRDSAGNGDYEVVVTFPDPVTSLTSGSVTPASGKAASADAPVISGNQVRIDLHNVSNAQLLHVNLAGLSAGPVNGTMSIPMIVLLGDVNGDGTVNSADATVTRNLSGQTADATNFRADVNLDGTVNSADATVVRANSGMTYTASAPVMARQR
ncbi:MAG: dockerin type I domain-containing protein, partial [Chthoniobacterales bacterium]